MFHFGIVYFVSPLHSYITPTIAGCSKRGNFPLLESFLFICLFISTFLSFLSFFFCYSAVVASFLVCKDFANAGLLGAVLKKSC